MVEEEDKETGYAVVLAITLAIVVSLFAIAMAIGTAIGQSERKPDPTAEMPSIVRVIALVFFAPGEAELPADAPMLLAPAIRAAGALQGAKLVVSGYIGDAEANAALAGRRAAAVRDALLAAGIGERRIELARPLAVATGTDSNAAHRVELTLR